MVDDDGALIRRYLDGEPEAFEALVRRHGAALLGFLRWRTRDPAVAEDLLQETFLRALRYLPAYRHRDRLRAWLVRIARNLAIDRERREGALRVVSTEAGLVADDPDGPTLGQTLPAPARDEPERVAVRRELAAAAERALAALHPLQREVFVLRQAGLSFKEIAALQGCPVNTALGRMHDAVTHLRRKLEELEEG